MQLTRFGRHLSLALRGSMSVSFVALAACATTGGGSLSTGPSVNFQMSGGAGQTSAVINKDGAQGPSIDLGRYDDGATLRGTVSGQPLQMTVSGNSAKGQWGSQPITVEVQETPGMLKMNGLVAGQLSNWTATKEVIEGKIGLCAYQLGRVGTDYKGTQTCGGQVTVQFPNNILEWKPINIAVLMALLMSTP
jgi:hypothetical protein